ncbi:hypothetical protein F6R98_20575 [Candidatus Methylospira mobilis]|uniref:Spore coat protein n=1 Tax=Candidatus Methylospira mobilis TaxID=1808979 RepID=A0A5Q0BSS2_9GAMM|nr:hypothetical protein [Candidatus Methylospira mobilis]QFY44726.1 hypothetical protein F6R98_20575 [Candidatus Methylospira mobilis]
MNKIICAIAFGFTFFFHGCAGIGQNDVDTNAGYAGYGNPYYSAMYGGGMGMTGGMYGNGIGGGSYGNGMYNYDLYGDRMQGYGINGMGGGNYGMPGGLGWGGWRY